MHDWEVWLSRSDHTHEEKESTIEELVREITALWQTDELRRKKPSALDGDQQPTSVSLATCLLLTPDLSHQIIYVGITNSHFSCRKR